MKNLFLLLVACLALSACGTGTVVPDNVGPTAKLPDSSTPKTYPVANNGFIGYYGDQGWISVTLIENGKTVKIKRDPVPADGQYFGVITSAKVSEYNILIGQYAVQYEKNFALALHPSDGVVPWTDPYGNSLFRIDQTHLNALAWLDQWKRNAVAPDPDWKP